MELIFQPPKELKEMTNLKLKLEVKTDANFFKKSPEQTQEILNQLGEAESKLDAAFSRWEELEEL